MPLKALTLEVKRLPMSDSEEGLVGNKYLGLFPLPHKTWEPDTSNASFVTVQNSPFCG